MIAFYGLILNFLFQARKWPECAIAVNVGTAISGKEGNSGLPICRLED